MMRRGIVPSTVSLQILNPVVSMVANNPIARAVERHQIQRGADELETMALAAADGAHNPVLIADCVDMLVLASLAVERGWTLETTAKLALSAAVDALISMARNDQTWDASQAEKVAYGLAIAGPVMAALPPQDISAGAMQMRKIELEAKRAAAAQEVAA